MKLKLLQSELTSTVGDSISSTGTVQSVKIIKKNNFIILETFGVYLETDLVVTGLTASYGTSTEKISLQWSPHPDADGYKVVRVPNSLLTVQTGVTFDDTQQSAGVLTKYGVKTFIVKDGITYDSKSVFINGWKALQPTVLTTTPDTINLWIVLNWNSVPGATAYKVFRTQGGNPDLLSYYGITTGTYFVDKKVNVNTVYTYSVKSSCILGDSVFSNNESTSLFAPVPSTPTNITASTGTFTDKIKIAWDPVPNTLFYNVYRNTTGNRIATNITNTEFEDFFADPDEGYTYGIGAQNNVGEGVVGFSPSGWKGLTAPSNFVAADGGFTNSIQLNWSPVSGAKSYTIFKGSPLQEYQIGIPGVSFNDTSGVEYGTIYNYGVRAVGNLSQSNIVEDTGFVDQSRPEFAPTGVSASDGAFTDRVEIQWNPVTTIQGVSGYQVFKGSDQLTITSSTSTIDINITPGATAEYFVRAFNEAGNGPLSSGNTGWRKLSPPSTLTASTNLPTQINLNWSVTQGATAYKVFTGKAFNPDVDVTLLGVTTNTQFTDFTPTFGNGYTYAVKSSCVLGDSEYSSTALGRVTQSPPEFAPTGVSASDGAFTDRVEIQWNPVTTIQGVSGYQVFKGSDQLTITSSTSTIDINITPGATAEYFVRASNLAGFGPLSSGNTGWIKLSSPSNLIASKSTSFTEIFLNWSGVNGAQQYKIFRGTPSSLSLLDNTTNTFYTNSGLSNGDTFAYAVKASVSLGDSDFSNIDIGETGTPIPLPDPPTGVSASDGAFTDKIRIQWNSVAGISGYVVFRDDEQINLTTNETYDDTTSLRGITFNYSVASRNVSGIGTRSSTNEGWKKLIPPTTVTATINLPDRINLNWSAAQGATAYKVFTGKAFSPDVGVTLLGVTTNTQFIDFTPTFGNGYTYAIKSSCPLGDSEYSSLVLGRVTQSPPEFAPTGVSASDGAFTDRVFIEWNPVTTIQGVSGYQVFKGSDQLTITSSTSTIDINITPGATAEYFVRAFNEAGNGPLSSGNTGWIKLSPPQQLQATTTFPDRINLSWLVASGATAYKVFTGKAFNPDVDVTLLGVTTNTQFTDFTPTFGNGYTYAVKSSCVLGDSEYSSTALGRVTQSPPEFAPTGVSASDGAFTDRVFIEWNPVTTIQGVSGYIVNKFDSSGAPVRNPQTAATSLTDTFGTPGITFTYRIQAFNLAGNGPLSSGDLGWKGLSAPTQFSATDGTFNDRVQLTWNSIHGSEISYRVYKGNPLSPLTTTTTTSFTDTSAVASPGVTLQYAVTAFSAFPIESTFSNLDTGFIGLDAPTGVLATNGSLTDRVQITWNPVAGAQQYKIYKDQIVLPIGITFSNSFGDTLATPGITHQYFVSTFLPGFPYESTKSSGITGWRKLSAPTGLIASKGDFSDRVRISWNSVAGATAYKIFNFNQSVPKIILYDGTTGDHTSNVPGIGNGYTSSAELDALGSMFTPNINFNDFQLDGSRVDVITLKGMTTAINNLQLQGITKTSVKKYGWIELEAPWENYILFEGYTGPADTTDQDNRNKTVTTWSKILLGGTGTNSVGAPDGTTFLGIKQAFPGISWGWYNQPGTFPYYISGTPLTQITDTQLETITDFAAEQWVNNLGNWSTNLDLLMPSLYISVTEKDLEKAHTKWSIKLCKKINQKFITKGVSPKPIVPFVSPITQTQASSTPYAKNASQTYMPPQSILTNDQMKEWFLQQLVDENVDGIQIWQNMAYGAKTIIGRQLYSGSFAASGYTYPFCFEEQPIGYSGPAFAPCAGNPQNSWRKGPDGITPNPFSWRTLGRQAISAYSNYIKGVYMGITANFWWYNEISGSTLNTPPEWTPLNQNKVWGMTAGVTAGTETTGINLVHETLFDASKRCIQTYIGLLPNLLGITTNTIFFDTTTTGISGATYAVKASCSLGDSDYSNTDTGYVNSIYSDVIQYASEIQTRYKEKNPDTGTYQLSPPRLTPWTGSLSWNPTNTKDLIEGVTAPASIVGVIQGADIYNNLLQTYNYWGIRLGSATNNALGATASGIERHIRNYEPGPWWTDLNGTLGITLRGGTANAYYRQKTLNDFSTRPYPGYSIDSNVWANPRNKLLYHMAKIAAEKHSSHLGVFAHLVDICTAWRYRLIASSGCTANRNANPNSYVTDLNARIQTQDYLNVIKTILTGLTAHYPLKPPFNGLDPDSKDAASKTEQRTWIGANLIGLASEPTRSYKGLSGGYRVPTPTIGATLDLDVSTGQTHNTWSPDGLTADQGEFFDNGPRQYLLNSLYLLEGITTARNPEGISAGQLLSADPSWSELFKALRFLLFKELRDNVKHTWERRAWYMVVNQSSTNPFIGGRDSEFSEDIDSLGWIQGNQWVDPLVSAINIAMYLYPFAESNVERQALLAAYNMCTEHFAGIIERALYKCTDCDQVGAWTEGLGYAAQSYPGVLRILNDMRRMGDRRLWDTVSARGRGLSYSCWTNNAWKWSLSRVMPNNAIINAGSCDSSDYGGGTGNGYHYVAWPHEHEALLASEYPSPGTPGSAVSVYFNRNVRASGSSFRGQPLFYYELKKYAETPQSKTQYRKFNRGQFFQDDQTYTWHSDFLIPYLQDERLNRTFVPQTNNFITTTSKQFVFALWGKGSFKFDGKAHRDEGHLSAYMGDAILLQELGEIRADGSLSRQRLEKTAAGHNIMQLGEYKKFNWPRPPKITGLRLGETGGSIFMDLTQAYNQRSLTAAPNSDTIYPWLGPNDFVNVRGSIRAPWGYGVKNENEEYQYQIAKVTRGVSWAYERYAPVSSYIRITDYVGLSGICAGVSGPTERSYYRFHIGYPNTIAGDTGGFTMSAVSGTNNRVWTVGWTAGITFNAVAGGYTCDYVGVTMTFTADQPIQLRNTLVGNRAIKEAHSAGNTAFFVDQFKNFAIDVSLGLSGAAVHDQTKLNLTTELNSVVFRNNTPIIIPTEIPQIRHYSPYTLNTATTISKNTGCSLQFAAPTNVFPSWDVEISGYSGISFGRIQIQDFTTLAARRGFTLPNSTWTCP